MTAVHAPGVTDAPVMRTAPSLHIPRLQPVVDPKLLALYNECGLEKLDETALSTIIRDVDSDPSLVPLLCVSVYRAVQRYNECLPNVPKNVLSDLKNELTIVKIIKENTLFFEQRTQALIAKCM